MIKSSGIILFVLLFFSCSTDVKKNKTASKVEFNCDTDSLLSAIIDREQEVLDNGSKLFWDFNCDSSWLTFQSPLGNKKILFSLPKELMELTNRLGHSGYQEFNTTILYTHRTISGCCVPDEHYLYNKQNGELIQQLGSALYVGNRDSLPFFASLKYVEIDSTLKKGSYKVVVLNLENGKQLTQSIPISDVERGMKNNDYMYPDDMFDTPIVKNNILEIYYHIDKYENGAELKQKVIKFDLSTIQ